MKESNDILGKIKGNDGISVPEGYFADFAARMTASLPERPEIESDGTVVAMPRTFWQKIRPYTYMAAMFAGVWCMLKMFSLMSSPADPLSIESYPELAYSLGDEQFMKEYVADELNQWDLIDELSDDYVDLDSLPMPDDNDIDGESIHNLPENFQ